MGKALYGGVRGNAIQSTLGDLGTPLFPLQARPARHCPSRDHGSSLATAPKSQQCTLALSRLRCLKRRGPHSGTRRRRGRGHRSIRGKSHLPLPLPLPNQPGKFEGRTLLHLFSPIPPETPARDPCSSGAPRPARSQRSILLRPAALCLVIERLAPCRAPSSFLSGASRFGYASHWPGADSAISEVARHPEAPHDPALFQ